MDAYTIYDTATGRIKRSGYCQPDTLALQIGVGESAINVLGDGAAQYVNVSTLALIAKPARPSPAHVWDDAAQAWIDPRGLPDFKADQVAVILAARDAAVSAALPTPVALMSADADAQAAMLEAAVHALIALISNAAISTNLRSQAGAPVGLTAAQVVDVFLLFQQRKKLVYDAADAALAQINAATTVPGVQMINLGV